MKILNDTSVRELKGSITEDVLELIRSSYENGYKQGRQDGRMERSFEEIKELTQPETPQQKRDRIVEQAKADIYELIPDDNVFEGWYYRVLYERKSWACNAEFIVNKEKRTVVALLKGYIVPRVYARGIAKCAPDDCFNVHIGKAIALLRALDLEVPDDYIHAPQPTEVRVGDRVERFNLGMATVIKQTGNARLAQSGLDDGSISIIDDSRDE